MVAKGRSTSQKVCQSYYCTVSMITCMLKVRMTFKICGFVNTICLQTCNSGTGGWQTLSLMIAYVIREGELGSPTLPCVIRGKVCEYRAKHLKHWSKKWQCDGRSVCLSASYPSNRVSLLETCFTKGKIVACQNQKHWASYADP